MNDTQVYEPARYRVLFREKGAVAWRHDQPMIWRQAVRSAQGWRKHGCEVWMAERVDLPGMKAPLDPDLNLPHRHELLHAFAAGVCKLPAETRMSAVNVSFWDGEVRVGWWRGLQDPLRVLTLDLTSDAELDWTTAYRVTVEPI